MKNSLKEIDIRINFWQNIVDQYPNSIVYKELLYKTQQQRVDLVNKIGRSLNKRRK